MHTVGFRLKASENDDCQLVRRIFVPGRSSREESRMLYDLYRQYSGYKDDNLATAPSQ